MKRYGNIYYDLCQKENIARAIAEASRGKRDRNDVRKVLEDMDYYINEIHEVLMFEKFRPSNYKTSRVIDGSMRKERIIFKPNFYPDQIVHWCIYLSIRKVIYDSMHAISCGSVPGKGVHYGKRFVEKWVREDTAHTMYYLKIDIKKYYPSVKKDVLMDKLRRKFKDEKLLRLIELILSKNDALPIGMLLSQVFANFYLSETDFFIKQKLKIRYYIRYMDDMVMFSGSKEKLHRIREELEKRLAEDGLKMKENWQVYKFDEEPLDFMGFRFYRDHTSLRRNVMLKITRKVSRVYKKGKKNVTHKDAAAIISYLGWIKHSDSYGLYKDRIEKKINIKKLKGIARRYSLEAVSKRKQELSRIMG